MHSLTFLVTEPPETLFRRGPNWSMKYERFKRRDVTPNRSTWSCYDELVYRIKYRALQFYKNIESVIIIVGKVVLYTNVKVMGLL